MRTVELVTIDIEFELEYREQTLSELLSQVIENTNTTIETTPAESPAPLEEAMIEICVTCGKSPLDCRIGPFQSRLKGN